MKKNKLAVVIPLQTSVFGATLARLEWHLSNEYDYQHAIGTVEVSEQSSTWKQLPPELIAVGERESGLRYLVHWKANQVPQYELEVLRAGLESKTAYVSAEEFDPGDFVIPYLPPPEALRTLYGRGQNALPYARDTTEGCWSFKLHKWEELTARQQSLLSGGLSAYPIEGWQISCGGKEALLRVRVFQLGKGTWMQAVRASRG